MLKTCRLQDGEKPWQSSQCSQRTVIRKMEYGRKLGYKGTWVGFRTPGMRHHCSLGQLSDKIRVALLKRLILANVQKLSYRRARVEAWRTIYKLP